MNQTCLLFFGGAGEKFLPGLTSCCHAPCSALLVLAFLGTVFIVASGVGRGLTRAHYDHDVVLAVRKVLCTSPVPKVLGVAATIIWDFAYCNVDNGIKMVEDGVIGPLVKLWWVHRYPLRRPVAGFFCQCLFFLFFTPLVASCLL